MTFGEGFASPVTPEAADWVGMECTGVEWTVGSLIPRRYESYLEVESPPTEDDSWWDAYRAVFMAIADEACRASESPPRAWYAVWEGHGFEVPRAEIDGLCRFTRPTRSYFLFRGDVSAVASLHWPGEPERWFRPDLWWPDDRAWFVGTDVDFWRVYVGGAASFTAAVAAAVRTRSHFVRPDHVLEPED